MHVQLCTSWPAAKSASLPRGQQQRRLLRPAPIAARPQPARSAWPAPRLPAPTSQPPPAPVAGSNRREGWAGRGARSQAASSVPAIAWWWSAPVPAGRQRCHPSGAHPREALQLGRRPHEVDAGAQCPLAHAAPGGQQGQQRGVQSPTQQSRGPANTLSPQPRLTPAGRAPPLPSPPANALQVLLVHRTVPTAERACPAS